MGIFFGFGSIFMLKKILCCEGFDCNMMTIFELLNPVLMIALIVLWFVFADALSNTSPTSSDWDDQQIYAIVIGVIYILMALSGVFMFLDICCCNDEPEKPSYGSNDGYGSDGYGNNKPSYGGGYDDTTTGYGQQPQPNPGYGNQQPNYGNQNQTGY